MRFLIFFLFPVFLFADEGKYVPLPMWVRFHLSENVFVERAGALRLAMRSNDLISVGVRNNGLSVEEQSRFSQSGVSRKLAALLEQQGEVFLPGSFYFEGGSFEKIKEYQETQGEFSGESLVLTVNLTSGKISVKVEPSSCGIGLSTQAF